MPRKVHLLILAIAFHLAAAQSPNLPFANISGSFYGLPQRNDLHLRTSQVVKIVLTNIEWDGSLQSDDTRKYNLVRNVINGAPGFAHGLNANRELQISDFQIRLVSAQIMIITMPAMPNYELPPMATEEASVVRIPDDVLSPPFNISASQYIGTTSRSISMRTVSLDLIPSPTNDCHPVEPWMNSVPHVDCSRNFFGSPDRELLTESIISVPHFAVYRIQLSLHCPSDHPCGWHDDITTSASIRKDLAAGIFNAPSDLQDDRWHSERSKSEYAGFDNQNTLDSILNSTESVLRLSDTVIQVLVRHLAEFNLIPGTREVVHFAQIPASAMSVGDDIVTRTGHDTATLFAMNAYYSGDLFFPIITNTECLAAPVYDYVPSKDNLLSFIPTSELQTVTARHLHIDLTGNIFAYDIATNSDKRHRIVISILSLDTSTTSSVYPNGLLAHANAGAFDDLLVRVNDTRIRLTITAQSTLYLPAGATERIAHADLPSDSLVQYSVPYTAAIDRAGQMAIDVRAVTAQYSGNFFTNEPTTSAQFSGNSYTDLAMRIYTHDITVMLHGSTWRDEHTLMAKCGLRQAVLASDRGQHEEGYSAAMTASLLDYVSISRIDPTEVRFTIRIHDYSLPPLGHETIRPLIIPKGCVNTVLDVSHQQQWVNTSGHYATLQPSEQIVARTATFTGDFFQDVSYDYHLRSQTVYQVHIELLHDFWNLDVTSNLQQLHALVKYVFKSSRNSAYPDYYIDGVDAALERGYFHTASSDSTFSSTTIFASRTSDTTLTIFVNAIPLLKMPPHGIEIITSAGIPAACLQSRNVLFPQSGDFTTTINQRTLIYNGFYAQDVTTAKHISEAMHTMTLDLHYDTWTSNCILQPTAQEQLLRSVFSSTLNSAHSFHTFLQSITVTGSGSRLTFQIPQLPSYTSLPSASEELMITTIPAECLSAGLDLSVKAHSSCIVDGAYQHRAVLDKALSCSFHSSTMIYAKAVAVYSGNFFFGIEAPRPPSYLQPSPGNTRDFQIEIELFDAAWSLQIPHSYEKKIDLISMVLRSNKRRSAPDYLTTGWEALTWPEDGNSNARQLREVDLEFELLSPTILRIIVPRMANYGLSIDTGEIISAGVINETVLSSGIGAVEYRHGLSELQIVLPDGVHQNVARGKPTTQSSDTSIQPTGYSYKAVDDMHSLYYPDGACSRTLFEERPWWRVDLGSAMSVRMVAFVTPETADSVKINSTRIIEVRLGSQQSRASVQARTHPLCGTRTVQSGTWTMVPCAGRVGRWLSLRAIQATELALCEVQVFSAGSLISRHRAAEQSSSHKVYTTELNANLATDGYRYSSMMDGSCSITLPEHEPWWRVSLDFSYKVRAVLFWLKTDSPIMNGDTLVNATVRIGDSIDNNGKTNAVCGTVSDGFDSTLSTTTCSNRDGTVSGCTTGNHTVPLCPVQEVVCDPELVGRYLTIVIPPQAKVDGHPADILRVLSLCEVEVFGVE